MWNVDDSGGGSTVTSAVVKPGDPRADAHYYNLPYTDHRHQHQQERQRPRPAVTTIVDASADFTMHRARVQHKWEVWPGKNQFFCGGRIVMAKQAGIFYLTLFLIFATSGLFFVFDCPYLAEKLTPVIPVVSGILFIFVLSNLFKTSF
jgi:hypothetical protein